ncbi:branched-chain amino acid ABC transporter permease [Chelativorans sp. M5D2P16]|uniref:branched-chain amino acid ABC transporter permease n=1 Tax=Chelativorans sp. M5D2P16 TaxID=3095678 RepID=UPI002ACAE72C|nr:branched-chain amino acid ABC transporter permease [Chelativorans sp. M5D2P16]MDZ5696550.1 branched-chain amino acid ABC transporter permease [Chelativorans sp. M5D2P16]
MKALEAASQLADVWQSRPARIIKIGLLIVLLIAVPPFLDNPYITRIFISAVMLGVMAAIYDLMIGYAGLINFGYAGFLAVGAYTSALGTFHYGVSPWIGLFTGGVATAFVGLLAGIISLRLRGLYVALLTFFVGEAIRFTISNLPDYTRGMLGLSVRPYPDILGIDFGRRDLIAYYYLLLVLASVIMGLMTWLVRSRYGLAFKAIREDQLATESLGLSATKYKLYNFTIASFLAGIMGAFYAHYLGILSPTPEEFGVYRTVEILTITYVGGRGTLWGSIFAGFLLVGFQEYFRGIGPWRLVIYGCLLIFVMLFARRGLSGLKKYVW